MAPISWTPASSGLTSHRCGTARVAVHGLGRGDEQVAGDGVVGQGDDGGAALGHGRWWRRGSRRRREPSGRRSARASGGPTQDGDGDQAGGQQTGRADGPSAPEAGRGCRWRRRRRGEAGLDAGPDFGRRLDRADLLGEKPARCSFQASTSAAKAGSEASRARAARSSAGDRTRRASSPARARSRRLREEGRS